MFRTMTAAAALVLLPAAQALAACCYFSAKDKDVNQPAQKVFITWEPEEKVETFTVQPKFEGNALDFGMVIPTPGRPKLDEMPKDFFKSLAVFTILKKREGVQSRVRFRARRGAAPDGRPAPAARPTVAVLEAGVVGSLDYKIIKAEDAQDLFDWLKENQYNYAGDAETLDFYVKKKWFFTVMKIDTMQMKKNPDGSYLGEVTPTRFRFQSDKLVYPLKITALSVKDRTEALFYVQTTHKVDLPGDATYMYQWLPMISNAQGWYDKGIFGGKDLPGGCSEFLAAVGPAKVQAMIQRGNELGFGFVSGTRPGPNKEGRVATTLEWAKKLTDDDIKVLKGEKPYSDPKPEDPGPAGWLVREAPAPEIAGLKVLAGHLQAGRFLTKFRKVFTKGEMTDDLEIVPAKIDGVEDTSEYEEILPTSPP
jgi:hypothetical protein